MRMRLLENPLIENSPVTNAPCIEKSQSSFSRGKRDNKGETRCTATHMNGGLSMSFIVCAKCDCRIWFMYTDTNLYTVDICTDGMTGCMYDACFSIIHVCYIIG